jgi:hypothetical protein
MPLAFAVVCEAAADFRTATALAERVIREQIDWIEEDSFVHCPLWHGVDQTRPCLLWREIPKLAAAAGIPPIHGHFDGRPAEPDARAALRALRFLKKKHEGHPLHGVFLIRDDDGDTSRRAGLEQARKAEQDFQDRIVLGLAHCQRESWVLAGFDPADAGEEDRLAEVRADLGFDPRLSSHLLTAKHDTDKRSAKRVLGVLTQADVNREAICWEKAPLTTLRQRGEETGLVAFLDEIGSRLIPLFASRPSA